VSDSGDALRPLYLLARDLPWWGALRRAHDTDAVGESARAEVLRALIERSAADPATAVADALLFGAESAWAVAGAAPGVHAALTNDVATIVADLAAFEAAEARTSPGRPRLCGLAPPPADVVSELRGRLPTGDDPATLVGRVLAFRSERGGGPLGRYTALRWSGARLEGVARPVAPDLSEMAELDGPMATLTRNTVAFLAGRPAMHALLYGPRGSGKSTVVRGLLARFSGEGLRLVEVPAEALGDLSSIVASLRDRPERFIVFVDDLSFESGDIRYHPLKSLLEGSVAERPANVRLYATSNRRHLVQERLRDRPDPMDDDVHAWDTHNERLALADRFGLLVTFPSSDQRRYLLIVRHLASRSGIDDPDLETRADRFARAGNGYSGRTARQFVDGLLAGLV